MALDAQTYSGLRYALFDALGYRVHEQAVADFHNSSARTKIVSCPARTSKSYAAAKDALPDVFAPGIELALAGDAESMLLWIVAPNYDLAKEFDYFWSDLVSRRRHLGFDYRLGQKSNIPKQGSMHIEIVWGKNRSGDDVTSRIEVKTATNEKSLQSEQVDVAILSEAARLPPQVWTKYLSTRTRRSIWPTTPDMQAAWIWEMLERGKAESVLDIESFQFTGRANPKYNWQTYWIEHANAESRRTGLIEVVPTDPSATPSADNGHDCFDELVGCKAMKDDGFAEQFGGRWVFHRGRVVPLRVKESLSGAPSHVIDYDPEWAPYAQFTVACDYGFKDNAVAGFWMTGPDQQVILRRCVYERGLVATDFVEAIAEQWEWLREHFDISASRAHRYVGDPKKPEVEELFRRAGLPVFNVDKRAQADRAAGHQALMNYLATDPATGMPRMLIHRDCKPIIKEWMHLAYSDNTKGDGTVSAFRKNHADDGYDMARYFVQSHPASRTTLTKVSDFERARRLVVAQNARKPKQATVPRAQQVVGWS